MFAKKWVVAVLRSRELLAPKTVPGNYLITKAQSLWGGEAGVWVEVCQGSAWVTLGKGGGDLIFGEGESFFLEAGMQAVLSPLGGTALLAGVSSSRQSGVKLLSNLEKAQRSALGVLMANGIAQ